ncbi:amidohydrolase [Chloroherpeton thalassium ATCC 35110]|uniref:Amidohydrolase n=1 Tax=Chloroherpeton thalassium (strain ATCC 35110 / GB-78) TaxID=517418 RepID=B3QT49_CHLT3|nr:M20 family metallopeptidase [Chloroherpeton thalassium]ACF14148.1 amidohydrolase [Chloroherpeton thalassium ATCC 35110]
MHGATEVPLKEQIKTKANEIFDEVVELRRDIHRHPELAFEEKRTSQLAANYLRELGYEVTQGVAKTGVVADLKGGKATATSKTIAFRADMDALPMNEENSHNFCSTKPNVMHACGHDAHTAMMLGAAKILASLQAELPGSIKFIFQPSEECAPGGAKLMLESGLFADKIPDAIFGQHCMPQVPVGKIGFLSGAMMAAADELYINVFGKGGHASAPHRANDPILAAVQIVNSLQTIVSRNFPPHEPAVLTIAAINGGSATNIIPNEVKMKGTYRTMNEEWREIGHQRIEEIVHATAKAMGVRAEIEIRKGYPAVVNDKNMTEFAIDLSREYLGEANTITPEPMMAAEDFAYFLQACKGAYWMLGVGNEEKGIVHNIHSTHFDIDEEALRIGTGFVSYLAMNFLSK